jgi:hypothetical protein
MLDLTKIMDYHHRRAGSDSGLRELEWKKVEKEKKKRTMMMKMMITMRTTKHAVKGL